MIWTEENKELLNELYPIMSRKEIAEILGTTVPIVSAYCFKIGLNYKTRNQISWTQKKLKELNEMFSDPACSLEDIAEHFRTTKASISTIAYKNGMKRGHWFDEGLKECSRCGSLKEATTEFFPKGNGCIDGLHSWCKNCWSEYRRKGDNEINRLTVNQKKIIIAMYGRVPAPQIAEELGVKLHQVQHVIRSLQKKGQLKQLKPRLKENA